MKILTSGELICLIRMFMKLLTSGELSCLIRDLTLKSVAKGEDGREDRRGLEGTPSVGSKGI